MPTYNALKIIVLRTNLEKKFQIQENSSKIDHLVEG
jgi:hypothetical protein